MGKRCLLIKLPDEREFFTYEKNHPYLLEFANTFDAKVRTVEAQEPHLLNLSEIAKCFCDHSYRGHPCNYHEIAQPETSTKIMMNHTSFSTLGSRSKMLQKVSDVRNFIETQFLEGNPVRIKELHKRFQKHGVAVSTLYRHISIVRDRLKRKGHQVSKIAAGCYKLQK